MPLYPAHGVGPAVVTLGVTSPLEGWDRATRSSRSPAEVAPGFPWREPVPAILGQPWQLALPPPCPRLSPAAGDTGTGSSWPSQCKHRWGRNQQGPVVRWGTEPCWFSPSQSRCPAELALPCPGVPRQIECFTHPQNHRVIFRLEKPSRITEPELWPIPTLSPECSFGFGCLQLWPCRSLSAPGSRTEASVPVLGREVGIQVGFGAFLSRGDALGWLGAVPGHFCRSIRQGERSLQTREAFGTCGLLHGVVYCMGCG